MLLQFLCMADGSSSLIDGHYYVSYDPEFHAPDGSYDGGLLETSSDPAQAYQFRDAGEAFLAWKQGPTCTCHRLRQDGKPQRPLTQFTITLKNP